MLEVVNGMDDEEKEVLSSDDEWIVWMKQLIKLGSVYGMYEKLGDVLNEVEAVEFNE